MLGSVKYDSSRPEGGEYAEGAEAYSQRSSRLSRWADKITMRKGRRVLKKKHVQYPLVSETSREEFHEPPMLEQRESLEGHTPRMTITQHQVDSDYSAISDSDKDKLDRGMKKQQKKEEKQKEEEKQRQSVQHGNKHEDVEQQMEKTFPRDSSVAIVSTPYQRRKSLEGSPSRLRPERCSDDLRRDYVQQEGTSRPRSSSFADHRGPNVEFVAAPIRQRASSEGQRVPGYVSFSHGPENDPQGLSSNMAQMDLAENTSAFARGSFNERSLGIMMASGPHQCPDSSDGADIREDPARESSNFNKSFVQMDLNTVPSAKLEDSASDEYQYQLVDEPATTTLDEPTPTPGSELPPMPGAFPRDSDINTKRSIDTDYSVDYRPAVTHQEIERRVHTIYEPVRTRSIHYHEYRTYIQPIYDLDETT